MLALPLGMKGFTYDSLLERTVRSSKKDFRQQESQQLQQSLRASHLNTSTVGGHIEWKPEHFPHKMYDLLEDVERKGLDDIVSWLPDGKSFKIHSQIGFEQSIMPLYFSGMSSYKSFRRQLNLYGIYQHRHRPNQDANGKFTEVSGGYCCAVRTNAYACKESSSHALHRRVFQFQHIRTIFSSEANAIFVTTSSGRKRILPTRIRQDPLPRRVAAAPGRAAARNETDLLCSRWWTNEIWRPLRNHESGYKSPCPSPVLGS